MSRIGDIVRRPTGALLTLVFSLGCATAALVAADRILGMLRPAARGLVLPPNTSIRFDTAEHHYSVHVNSMGFRDREFSDATRAGRRVLAIGDSFTFGMGVEAADAWPKQLERLLQERGVDAEVANLGRPGQSPVDYADVAEQAVPVLRPDLVIVGVVQATDLFETERTSGRNLFELWLSRRSGFLDRALPNLVRLVNPVDVSAEDVRDGLSRANTRFVSGLDRTSRVRLERLDEPLREAFLRGDHFTSPIDLIVTQPTVFLDKVRISELRRADLVEQMAHEFARIRAVAERYGTRVIVVSIPYAFQVSRSSLERYRRLGLELDDTLLTSIRQDDEIRSASARARVEFVSLLPRFRQPDAARLYFELDPHLTSEGNRLAAEALLPAVEADLARAKQVPIP